MLLIDPIDLISRKQQRDVFYVKFSLTEEEVNDWKKPTVRQFVTDWLEKNGISWQPCAAFSEGITSYQGDIYVDVAKDSTSGKLLEFLNFMENDQGHSRIQGAAVYLLTLSAAMQNAYQDEQEYWETF